MDDPMVSLLAVIVLSLSPAPADARAEFQSAVSSAPEGSTLVVPPGTYDIGQAPGLYYGVLLDKPLTILGEPGSLLRQPATGPSVRMFQVTAQNVVFNGLTIDGQSGLQATDEHHAAAFVTSSGFSVYDTEIRGFMGDGLYAYDGASNLTLDGVNIHANTRNGVTLGGNLSQVRIQRGSIYDNGAQQIDSEPGKPSTVNDVTISGMYLVSGAQYALTISGSGSQARSSGWFVTNSVIVGGVNLVWTDNVSLVGNVISRDTTAVKVYRNCHNTYVVSNSLASTDPLAYQPATLYALGTVGQPPSSLWFVGNTITAASGSSFGIRVQGAEDVTIVNNTADHQVYVRGTAPMHSVVMVGNVVASTNIIGPGPLSVLRYVGNSVTTTAGTVTDGSATVTQAVGNTYVVGTPVSARLGE